MDPDPGLMSLSCVIYAFLASLTVWRYERGRDAICVYIYIWIFTHLPFDKVCMRLRVLRQCWNLLNKNLWFKIQKSEKIVRNLESCASFF